MMNVEHVVVDDALDQVEQSPAEEQLAGERAR